MNTSNVTPYNDINAFGGRMSLHKGDGRIEEMYYFLCFDWSQLRKMLVDPVDYFANQVKLETDAPMAPVVAIIEPALQPLMNLPGSIRRGGETFKALFDVHGKLFGAAALAPPVASFFNEVFPDSGSNDQKIFEFLPRSKPLKGLGELPSDGKGWFFVEFANRTSVLHIYYHAPEDFSRNDNYKNGFTMPTVCKMQSGDFAQVHFDLITGPSTKDPAMSIEVARAEAAVDYLEDGGARMCAELNTSTERESGTLERIVTRPVNDQAARQGADPDPLLKGLKFKTQAMLDGNPGPKIIIEGLSTSKNGVNSMLLPPYVCLVSESYLSEGESVFRDGVWKTYHSRGN